MFEISGKKYPSFTDWVNTKMWVEAKSQMNQSTQIPIDSDTYPPIPGLEGPFRFKNGRILYYDPNVGQYYDRLTDIYVDNSEMVGMS